MSNIANIEFKDAGGNVKTISDFKGKAYLVVNTASKCGLTPQYEGLEALYEKYKDKGLVVLGFPDNEFLAQEPGTNEEIQEFCRANFNIKFPVNEKIVVKGEGQHPLYKALTTGKKEAVKNQNGEFEAKLTGAGLITGAPEDIHWNFEKFLVDADGNIVERYFPDIAPNDERITTKIESLLG